MAAGCAQEAQHFGQGRHTVPRVNAKAVIDFLSWRIRWIIVHVQNLKSAGAQQSNSLNGRAAFVEVKNISQDTSPGMACFHGDANTLPEAVEIFRKPPKFKLGRHANLISGFEQSVIPFDGW